MKKRAARSKKHPSSKRKLVVKIEPPAPRKARATTAKPAFDKVLHFIEAARRRAYQAVNVEMVDLYMKIGGYVSGKIASEGWGKGTVEELSLHIQRQQPGIRGFSPQNIWRMRQFFEICREEPILSPLVRELNWTLTMIIVSRCKRAEEREFYARMAVREGWGKRDLDRQINTAFFERSILSPPKLSPLVRELHPQAETVFKDVYTLEFLGLPASHTEADLHRGLLTHLRKFITELGRDFCFLGSEVPLQVGQRDFSLDLLFFNRTLNCLVAFELKLGQFEPEHIGKLNFYLETLDRTVKKSHEKPSIGVLLCASRDQEVVEFALRRSDSPTLIAEYHSQLPDRELLRQKLHEFYELTSPNEEKPAPKKRK